jgi:hypothetical protein
MAGDQTPIEQVQWRRVAGRVIGAGWRAREEWDGERSGTIMAAAWVTPVIS